MSIKSKDNLIPMPQFSIERQVENITPHQKLQFETHIVEHCNLNCQMCTHFSPLAQTEFADINMFEKDLQRLHELFVDDVTYIMLLGGEPLLHPLLTQFLKIARKTFPYTDIILYTNGILIPKMNEKFFETCKVNKILIVLTRYPIQMDYSVVNNLLDKYGINYKYCNTPGREKKSTHYPLDTMGNQNSKNSFLNCDMANRCIFLKNGKLYTCPMIPNVHHFNKYFNYNFEVTQKDYVDIYESINKTEILEFLASPPPFCRYCDVSNRSILHDWKRSKRSIEEWTLSEHI